MAVSDAFRDFILDLLVPMKANARRMFGGVGMTCDGIMFALLSRDELFFRVDDQSRARYEAEGCAPFGYNRAGRNVVMAGYYGVPQRLYDEPDELLAWARQALAAAKRARTPRLRGATGQRRVKADGY